jgi:hypothetical protein
VPKKKAVPGRIISLHDLPPGATEASIRALLPDNNGLLAYKRNMNADTGDLSELAFLLIGTEKDAYRGFCALGEVESQGQVVMVNNVSGVKFEVNAEE